MLAIAIATDDPATSTSLELLLHIRSDYLLDLFRRNTLVAAVFSVVLSAVLGMLFGAAGMVVFLAAVASTATTTLVYKSGLLVGMKRLRERW